MAADAPQVAVVTGAANGIGNAISAALADVGYAVALLDIADPSEAADRINSQGGRALPIQVDVADTASVSAALERTREELGTPTAAFTAAGVARMSPFLDLEPEAWERTIRVNLTGTFLVLQGCARMMVEAGTGGAMVAIASLSGRGPSPDNSDYAASKAGVISLVKSMAVTLAGSGIRVNAICPGVIDTQFTTNIVAKRAAAAKVTTDQLLADMVSKVPLGRMAAPSEVATVGLSLISPAFSYVTGQAINVCGGLQFN